MEFKKLFSPRKQCKIDPLNDGKGGYISTNEEIEKELFSTFFEAKHLSKETFDEEFFQEVHRLYSDIINDRFEYNGPESYNINASITIKEIQDAINPFMPYVRINEHALFSRFSLIKCRHSVFIFIVISNRRMRGVSSHKFRWVSTFL